MRWWMLWAALTVLSALAFGASWLFLPWPQSSDALSLRVAQSSLLGFLVFATLTVVSMFFGRSELDQELRDREPDQGDEQQAGAA